MLFVRMYVFMVKKTYSICVKSLSVFTKCHECIYVCMISYLPVRCAAHHSDRVPHTPRRFANDISQKWTEGVEHDDGLYPDGERSSA